MKSHQRLVVFETKHEQVGSSATFNLLPIWSANPSFLHCPTEMMSCRLVTGRVAELQGCRVGPLTAKSSRNSLEHRTVSSNSSAPIIGRSPYLCAFRKTNIWVPRIVADRAQDLKLVTDTFLRHLFWRDSQPELG